MLPNVVMPQMGESIAEGTIVRWIKKVGDTIDRDEPLFEISTDKVDAEIPSPAAGVLTEIKVKEGETVAGQQRRGDDRDGRRGARAGRPPPRRPCRSRDGRRKPRIAQQTAVRAHCDRARPQDRHARRRDRTICAARSLRRSCGASRRSTTSTSAQIHGTGISGRVTKHDILGYHRDCAGRAAPGRRRPGAAGRRRRRRRSSPARTSASSR